MYNVHNLKKTCLGIFFPFLAINCLPTSSKEIDKARIMENAAKSFSSVKKSCTEALNDTKNQLVTLQKLSFTAGSNKEDQILKIQKKFLQENYIPYLETYQEGLKYLEEKEEDISQKRCLKEDIRNVNPYLSYVKKITRENNSEAIAEVIEKIKL